MIVSLGMADHLKDQNKSLALSLLLHFGVGFLFIVTRWLHSSSVLVSCVISISSQKVVGLWQFPHKS